MFRTEEISTKVQEWILEHFPLARERKISPSHSLLESGIVDSLGILDILLFLEQEFKFTVEEDEMVEDHFESMDSITKYVESKLAD